MALWRLVHGHWFSHMVSFQLELQDLISLYLLIGSSQVGHFDLSRHGSFLELGALLILEPPMVVMVVEIICNFSKGIFKLFAHSGKAENARQHLAAGNLYSENLRDKIDKQRLRKAFIFICSYQHHLQIAAGRGLYHHEDGFASHQVVGIPNARRLAIGKDEYVIQLLSSMKPRLAKRYFNSGFQILSAAALSFSSSSFQQN